jgi:hypothetical protein
VDVSANVISESNDGSMTMKAFRLRGSDLSALWQAVACRLALALMVSGCFLVLPGCAMGFRTSPVLYKPSCDIRSVLDLQFPERIDTLAGVPRTETVFESGTNKFGGRLPDDIKEMFYSKKGDTEYKFMVFYSEAAAIKEYGRDKEEHVFRETTVNGLTGRVHYTEQPRADSEGGSVPMGYYISRADFRLHNIYIRVVTQDQRPENDELSNAVEHLAQMLNAALKVNQ